MSSLAASRADNFYIANNFDPNKPSRKPKPEHLKKDYSIIRFEVMFHIRCEQCERMIAKGERFNAHKKQVGMFHTTKIYEFLFNCPGCPQKIICKTDPENCDYIFTQGAKKFMSNDKIETDAIMLDTEKVLLRDPIQILENQIEDKRKSNLEKPRLMHIEQIQERLYDDFDLNRQLRKKFRVEKALIEQDEIPKNFGYKKIKLSDTDIQKSNNIDFKGLDGFRKNRKQIRDDIRTQSIFSEKKNSFQEVQKKLANLPQNTKKILQLEIKRNIFK